MAESEAPPEFLRNVESMTEFAQTIKTINDGATQNHAVTLAPAQCQSILWAMRLLKAGNDDGG